MDLENADGESLDIEELQKDVATPENLLLTEEIRQTVQRTISSLPDDLRLAITLREADGLSYEEIATAMECPIGTVRSRLHRARHMLKEQLKGYAESMGYSWNEANDYIYELSGLEFNNIDVDIFEGQVYISESEMKCEKGKEIIISFMEKNGINEFKYTN